MKNKIGNGTGDRSGGKLYHPIGALRYLYPLHCPWNNPSAWTDKHAWVKKYLGKAAEKRLILSHHKHLNQGDFLIDDRHDKNGADRFGGELIHFGPGNAFPDWNTVVTYLLAKV